MNGRSAGSTGGGSRSHDIDDRGEHFEVKPSARRFTPYVIASPVLGYLPCGSWEQDNFAHVQAGKSVVATVKKTSWLSTEFAHLRERLSIRAPGAMGFCAGTETRALTPTTWTFHQSS